MNMCRSLRSFSLLDRMVKEAHSRSKKGVNRGAWTREEDRRLLECIKIHGDKKWRSLPAKAGLNRCGKSCRLRWLNYLRPDIKRGNILEDEEDLIMRLHNLLGNRWSLIAGRLPGRTDNEIKNYWNTHLSKKSLSMRDLNLKINQKVKETRNPLPPMMITGPISSYPDQATDDEVGRDQNLGRWSDLLEKDAEDDIDVDKFFDLPGIGSARTEERPSPRVEDKKMIERRGEGLNSGLFEYEFMSVEVGLCSEQPRFDRLEFEVISRFLDSDMDLI